MAIIIVSIFFCDESEIENDNQLPKTNSKVIQTTHDFESENNSAVILKNEIEQSENVIELATKQNYGLVKIGSGIDIENGTISANIIQTATKNRLGYAKIGRGIDVEDGVISATEIAAATKNTKGIVKIGDDFELNENGEMELADMADASIIYKLDQMKICENGNIDLEEKKLIYRLYIASDVVVQINENFTPTQDYTFILELISNGTHLIAFSDQFKNGMTQLPINRGTTKIKISKKLGLPYYEATVYQHNAPNPINLTPVGSAIINSEFAVTTPQGGNWNPVRILRTSLDGFSDIKELQFDFETLVCVDYVNYISRSSSVAMGEFILRGSNDGKNWTTLLYRNGQVVYGKVYTEVKGCFRHYNLKIGYTSDDNKPGGVTLWGTQIDNNESELTALTPLMGSNITSFATFTSSKFVSNSAAQATDTDLGTFVAVGYDANQNRWAQYELATPAAANVLELDFYNYGSQTNWFTLMGSNDGTNWTLLLERQYFKNALSNNNYRVMIYNFQNETEYKYYRLNCLGTNDTIENWHIFGFKLYRRDTGKHNIYNLVPTLSSNSQDGYEATASSVWTNDSAHQPFYAFDGANNTKWASDGTDTQWLQIKLPSLMISDVVKIISRTDGDFNNQAPKDFEIQGSNDAETWITLTSQTNISWSSQGQVQTFEFENETAYQYYRLLITANNGGGSYSLGEFFVGNKVREYKRWLDKYDSLVPPMSSNSQDGYVASASSEFGGTKHPAYMAFNGVNGGGNKWLTASGAAVNGSWIKIRLPTAQAANVFTIRECGESRYMNRMLSGFKIQGSNNDSSWTTLVDVQSTSWSLDETKTWSIENETAYQFYRILISSNCEAGDGVALSEWGIYFHQYIMEY